MKTKANHDFFIMMITSDKYDDDDDVAEDGPAEDAGRGVFSARMSRDLCPKGQGPAQGQLQVQTKIFKNLNKKTANRFFYSAEGLVINIKLVIFF
jgi:hypothetical protein